MRVPGPDCILGMTILTGALQHFADRLVIGHIVALQGEHNDDAGSGLPAPRRPADGVPAQMHPAVPEPASPYFMDFRRPADRGYYYGSPPPPQNGVVLLKTDKGIVALSPGSIQRVDFGAGEPVCMTTNQLKRPAIRLELDKPARGERVEVSYLARGITWVPSYRIDLSAEKSARFSAQAQIIRR